MYIKKEREENRLLLVFDKHFNEPIESVYLTTSVLKVSKTTHVNAIVLFETNQ